MRVETHITETRNYTIHVTQPELNRLCRMAHEYVQSNPPYEDHGEATKLRDTLYKHVGNGGWDL